MEAKTTVAVAARRAKHGIAERTKNAQAAYEEGERLKKRRSKLKERRVARISRGDGARSWRNVR